MVNNGHFKDFDKNLSRNVVIKVVKRAIFLARLLNKASIKAKINHNKNIR